MKRHAVDDQSTEQKAREEFKRLTNTLPDGPTLKIAASYRVPLDATANDVMRGLADAQPATIRKVRLEPGWLEAVIADARARIAAMPTQERDIWQAAAKAILHHVPDPCRRPHACDAAQTCVGGCVYDQ